eukprot:jgi/Bigna1/89516/estExt_fgenesh1_pg.C_500116
MASSSSTKAKSRGQPLVSAFPGDEIDLKGLPTRLGNGVVQNEDEKAVASRYGIVKRSNNNRVWIDSYRKRYIASVGDWVLGVVTEKHSNDYRVDIGEDQDARLSMLSFEGATKRNRPNLELGSLVYCGVSTANKDMESELTCISPFTKKEWVTGQTLFGLLKGGYVFKCSLRLARSLISPRCHVLRSLGAVLKYELAVGMNGKVWVNASSVEEIVIISKIIVNSEFLSDKDVDTMIEFTLERIAK